LINDEDELLRDPNLTTTERFALTRARIGQGIFKEAVRQIEPICRVTGLSDHRHLVASHMKPWSKSDNVERLDGHNGLLLSPHVDNLFDRGLISFQRSGSVIVSPKLNPDVLSSWKLDVDQRGTKFSKKQLPYLEYHQDVVFQTN